MKHLLLAAGLVLGLVLPAHAQSYVTHQGGRLEEDCLSENGNGDAFTDMAPNTVYTIASDNAESPGLTDWDYIVTGSVQVKNIESSPINLTVDVVYGTQPSCICPITGCTGTPAVV
jgi:hypothetical protein